MAKLGKRDSVLEHFFAKAEDCLAADDYAGALEELQSASKRARAIFDDEDPTALKVVCLTADAHCGLKRHAEAAALYLTALSGYTGHASFVVGTHATDHDLQRALVVAPAVAETLQPRAHVPEIVGVYNSLAYCCYCKGIGLPPLDAGRYTSLRFAADWYDRAVAEAGPGGTGEVVGALQSKGGVLMKMGRWAEAAQAFEKALALARQDPTGRLSEGSLQKPLALAKEKHRAFLRCRAAGTIAAFLRRLRRRPAETERAAKMQTLVDKDKGKRHKAITGAHVCGDIEISLDDMAMVCFENAQKLPEHSKQRQALYDRCEQLWLREVDSAPKARFQIGGLCRLGELYCLQKRHDEGVRVLQRALDIRRLHKDPPEPSLDELKTLLEFVNSQAHAVRKQHAAGTITATLRRHSRAANAERSQREADAQARALTEADEAEARKDVESEAAAAWGALYDGDQLGRAGADRAMLAAAETAQRHVVAEGAAMERAALKADFRCGMLRAAKVMLEAQEVDARTRIEANAATDMRLLAKQHVDGQWAADAAAMRRVDAEAARRFHKEAAAAAARAADAAAATRRMELDGLAGEEAAARCSIHNAATAALDERASCARRRVGEIKAATVAAARVRQETAEAVAALAVREEAGRGRIEDDAATAGAIIDAARCREVEALTVAAARLNHEGLVSRGRSSSASPSPTHTRARQRLRTLHEIHDLVGDAAEHAGTALAASGHGPCVTPTHTPQQPAGSRGGGITPVFFASMSLSPTPPRSTAPHGVPGDAGARSRASAHPSSGVSPSLSSQGPSGSGCAPTASPRGDPTTSLDARGAVLRAVAGRRAMEDQRASQGAGASPTSVADHHARSTSDTHLRLAQMQHARQAKILAAAKESSEAAMHRAIMLESRRQPTAGTRGATGMAQLPPR